MAQIISEDYRVNEKGHLVPIDKISSFDLAQDKVVIELAQKAKDLQRYMREVKQDMFERVAQVIKESAEEHGVEIGGEKGNTTLYSFDRRYKVLRHNQDRVSFDATLITAKALLDEYLSELAENSDDNNIRAIITEIFDMDKEGHINHSRMAELCRISIEDDRWKKAIEIIGKSRQVVGKASYVRVYERDDKGNYQLINLDIAKV